MPNVNLYQGVADPELQIRRGGGGDQFGIKTRGGAGALPWVRFCQMPFTWKKQKIRGWKVKWFTHFVWVSSENMGCDLFFWVDAIFWVFLVCSVDLNKLCSGSYSHHVKFYSFVFNDKDSTRVFCVNGKHPKFPLYLRLLLGAHTCYCSTRLHKY